MKINKALVKHETRNMKWMLLYFLTIVIGGVLSFNSDLKGEYINFLTTGLSPDRSIILHSLRGLLSFIIVPIGFGILLMIYLQFKDSKSVEVGNFLKSLPVSNKEYYLTKFMGGFISLTIPLAILIVGVLAIRSSNMSWISDIQNISVFPDLVEKSNSIINTVSILTMSYLVAISTYAFLFMVQYIVMNIIAGLVIGSLIWASPTFIIMSLGMIYNQAIRSLFSPSGDTLFKIEETVFNYIQPWTYPVNVPNIEIQYSTGIDTMFDYGQIIYFKGLGAKILITLSIALLSIALGYILSKKSRVEDSDTLISFKWARRLFVIGVTVCSSLLLADISTVFLGFHDSIGFIMLHIIMIIGAIIGFIVSRRMTKIKSN